jgi:hypothetical protein
MLACNPVQVRLWLWCCEQNEDTALLLACKIKRGNLALVQWLVHAGSNVTAEMNKVSRGRALFRVEMSTCRPVMMRVRDSLEIRLS